MDIGTAKDMIEDMHHEIIGLRKEIAHYEKITDMAYTLAGGHIAGCLMGMMCNCGLLLYYTHNEAKQ
jgi:hypothetical protein